MRSDQSRQRGFPGPGVRFSGIGTGERNRNGCPVIRNGNCYILCGFGSVSPVEQFKGEITGLTGCTIRFRNFLLGGQADRRIVCGISVCKRTDGVNTVNL